MFIPRPSRFILGVAETTGPTTHEVSYTSNVASSITTSALEVSFSDVSLNSVFTISQTGGSDVDASLSFDANLTIAEIASLNYFSEITLNISEEINQGGVLETSGDLSLDIANIISQISTIDYISGITISFSESISELATVAYIGVLTIDVIPAISQSASLISDVEAVISIPLVCSLTTGAVFVTDQDYSQDVVQAISNVGNSVSDVSTGLEIIGGIQSSSNAEFIAAYNQDVISSIIQSAVKEIDGEAYITIGINLSDEYSVLATLSDDVTLNVIKSITSTVGNVLEAVYIDDVISSISAIGDTSIEGLLSLDIGLSVTETVVAIIESSLDVGVSLDDLYSTTEIAFVDYLSDVVLSDEYISGQELFTTVDLSVTVEVVSSAITTDFVVLTPNKRILISLGSDRIIASLSTDRDVLIVK